MDTTPADQAVIRTDVLGRVKTSAQRREQLLDEFERSGLSAVKYAELVGVKYQTLATWLQKRRRARGAYPEVPAKRVLKSESVQWLEAVVQEARHGGPAAVESIVVEVRGGGRVQISHSRQVALTAALLRELEKPC